MTAVLTLLRRRARAVREDGYALLMVLMATLVFGLIVVALLGMAMADLGIHTALRDKGVTQRAADGALQTWINELKTNPGATLGRKGDDCSSGPMTLGSTTVVVSCLGDTPSGTPVPNGLAGSTSLTLLGGFTGPVADLAQAPGYLGSWLSPMLHDLDTSLASNLPGFLHYGPKTLEIDGDVKVKQDALVWHEQNGVAIPGPAVSLTGRYVQGKTSGLLGGLFGWFTLFRWTPECGLLDPAFDTTWWDTFIGTLPDNGFHIAAAKGMSCSGANSITDPNWAAPTPVTPWSDARLRSGMALPANCDAKKPDPSVPVVRLDPGMYNRSDTAILNQWLRSGNCDGVTFWFPPGDYYFDAAGTVAGDINTRSAIVANDPSSNIVFGTPNGWDPATQKAPSSAFPGACVHDGTQPGATVTMSPRTTLKHFQGLIAACSARDADGNEKPLLYQTSGGDQVRWAGVPTAVTPTTFTNAGAALKSTATSKPANWPTNAGPYDTSEGSFNYATANCSGTYDSCSAKLSFTGFSDPAAYAYGDPASAVVRIRGTANNVAGNFLGVGSRTVVRVTFGDGSGSCTTAIPDVPHGDVAVDLINPSALAVFSAYPDLCDSNTVKDVAQLDGATVDVTVMASRGWAVCGPWYWPYYCDYSVGVDYAWIETTSGNKPPAIAHTSVDPTAANPISMTLYGPVYLPRTQVVVDWRGQPNTEAIFGGGLIARALASGIDWVANPAAQPGKLAGLSRVAGERKVNLAAVIDNRVRATASIRIVDSTPDASALSAGRQVEVLDWRTCSTPVPSPAPAVLTCPAPN